MLDPDLALSAAVILILVACALLWAAFRLPRRDVAHDAGDQIADLNSVSHDCAGAA